MIGKINKFQSFGAVKGKLDYLYDKKNQGNCNLILNNTMAEDGKYPILNSLTETAELNSNVANKYAEIILSIDPSESLDNDTWLEITDKYMNELGYGNSPYAVYLHKDKSHDHLHIITSAVDLDVNKVDQHYDCININNLNRQIEKEYNLKIAERDLSKESTSLSEHNYRKYYFQNALLKGLKGYNTRDFLQGFLSDKDQKLIHSTHLSNEQLKVLLGNDYNKIHGFLLKNKLFNTLYKDELKSKLHQIYNQSTSQKDYFNKCKENDIYVRKIYNKEGSPILEYGISTYYFKESSLPGKFRFNNIIGLDYDKSKNQHTYDEQKNYLKRNITIGLKNSNSLDDFYNFLVNRNIEPITHENKSGIYGLSFKSHNCSNPFVFKGSQLGYSYNRIIKELNQTPSFTEKIVPSNSTDNSIQNPLSLPYSPNVNQPIGESKQDEREQEEFKRKHHKRKKNKGRNL